MARLGNRLLIWAAALLLCGPTQASTHYELYLCAGQSNMDGRGRVADLPAPDRLPLDGAIIFYQNPPASSAGWKPFVPGYSLAPKYQGPQPSPTFGPEVGFVRTLLIHEPGRKIALIKVAKGGTSIEQWNPGRKGALGSQGPCYQNMLAAIAIATGQLTSRGDTYAVRGVLWHQGESNAHSPASEYEAKLTELIRRIREDLGSATLPFVLGQVYDNGERNTVMGVIHAVARQIPQVGYADSKGLKTSDQGTHFDAESQLILGRRYAEALRALEN